MIRWKLLLGISLTCVAIAACNRGAPEASTTSTPVSANKTTLPKPAGTADENQWGDYLIARAKILRGDTAMRQIYVIPGGDSVGAESRRKNERQSISGGIGTILMPGTLLILGGPDSHQTSDFVIALTKELKPGALNGIIVLVVANADQSSTVSTALESTGARVQFVAM